jgi:hypothetical protein
MAAGMAAGVVDMAGVVGIAGMAGVVGMVGITDMVGMAGITGMAVITGTAMWASELFSTHFCSSLGITPTRTTTTLQQS